MELSDLYILPKWQGKGMGTAILAHCIAQTNLPISLFVFIRNTGRFPAVYPNGVFYPPTGQHPVSDATGSLCTLMLLHCCGSYCL